MLLGDAVPAVLPVDGLQAPLGDTSRQFGVLKYRVHGEGEALSVVRVCDQAVLAVAELTGDTSVRRDNHRNPAGGSFQSHHSEGFMERGHEEHRTAAVDSRKHVLWLSTDEEHPARDATVVADIVHLLEDGPFLAGRRPATPEENQTCPRVASNDSDEGPEGLRESLGPSDSSAHDHDGSLSGRPASRQDVHVVFLTRTELQRVHSRGNEVRRGSDIPFVETQDIPGLGLGGHGHAASGPLAGLDEPTFFVDALTEVEGSLQLAWVLTAGDQPFLLEGSQRVGGPEKVWAFECMRGLRSDDATIDVVPVKQGRLDRDRWAQISLCEEAVPVEADEIDETLADLAQVDVELFLADELHGATAETQDPSVGPDLLQLGLNEVEPANDQEGRDAAPAQRPSQLDGVDGLTAGVGATGRRDGTAVRTHVEIAMCTDQVNCFRH